MSYLLGAGQIVVGIGILVAWWLALTFVGVRQKGRTMTAIGFAVVPSLFLLWATAGCILIVRGIGGL